MTEYNNPLDELCIHCGYDNGEHHAGSEPWPYEYCPGPEGNWTWESGPGTVFKGSGEYKDERS